MEWRLGDSSGISDRGTKAKTITPCDNAFVTNILLLTLRLHYAFAQKTFVAPRPCSEAAHRTPPGSSALRESEASAANVLSVRKRSVSNKAPSRNGNQLHVLLMSVICHK
ncbi:hypothetical protein [Lysinibacillus sp. TE18511]